MKIWQSYAPRLVMIAVLLVLTACGSDYTPRKKTAAIDPETGAVQPPYPCPDWSHSQRVNYDNSQHSNFGCATGNNLAVQLEDPRDLERGHGSASPDADATVDAITRYREGDLPNDFTPQQNGVAQ